MNDTFDEESALEEVGRIGSRINAILKKIETEDPGRPPDPEPETADQEPTPAPPVPDSVSPPNPEQGDPPDAPETGA